MCVCVQVCCLILFQAQEEILRDKEKGRVSVMEKVLEVPVGVLLVQTQRHREKRLNQELFTTTEQILFRSMI